MAFVDYQLLASLPYCNLYVLGERFHKMALGEFCEGEAEDVWGPCGRKRPASRFSRLMKAAYR